MPPREPLHRQSGCTCPEPTPPFDAVLDATCPVHAADVAALVIDAIDSGRAIQEQPPGRCELCGGVEETRPYGPNGEEVCFDCGMKDEEAMKQQFEKRMGWTT